MMETDRSTGDLLEILIPVGLVLTALLGCLLVAYGLRLFAPAPPQVQDVYVETRPGVVTAQAGDVVTYVVTLSNQATRGTLDILSVSDTLLGDLSASFVPRLEAGASQREVFAYTVRPGDPDPLTNTVTVSAGRGGEVVRAISAGRVDLLRPAVGVGAGVTPEAAPRGHEVIYSITASNVGEVDFGPITVTDSFQGDFSPFFPLTLPPGASWGKTFAWAVPSHASDPLSGAATVYAASPGEVVSDTAALLVDILEAALEVSTVISPAAIVPGETVSYTVSVRNVGEVDLEAITVTDSLQGDLSPSFPPTLTVGASRRCRFSWAIQSGESLPLTRTVTVRARGAGEVVSDTAAAVVGALKPDLRVEPSVVPTTAVRGGESTYTVTLVNAGGVDIEEVRVLDSLLGDISWSFPRILPAGTSHSEAYTWFSRADDVGPLTRSVTVSGQGAGRVVSDTVTTALDLVGIAASARGPERAREGDPVRVTVTVTNTSSRGAPDFVLESAVRDDRELTLPEACRVLAPDEICTFAYDVVVPSGEQVLSTAVELRYRPNGLPSVVTATARHTMAGASPWQKGAGIPAGLEVRALAVCPATPDLLYAGFGSAGRGAYWSGDAGLSWTATALQDEDVFGIAVHPQDCGTVYAAAWRDGVMRSEDGGRGWDVVSDGLEGAFVYSVVVDPTDPDVLYAGTAQQGVYRSENGGDTWRAWGLESLTVTDVSITADGEAVYAATWGDGVYRRPGRSSGGSSWAAVSDGIVEGHRELYAVAVDPQDESIAFAATSLGGVYRTLDGGGTWRRVLPSPQPAYAVIVDPERGEVVYAGTARGVYRSVAQGDPGSWRSFDSGLEDLAVRAVAVGPGQEVVHLGTADGAWRHPR
ncbi:MAG: hypothetical protein R6X31_09205 [Anaerolineae bacterium]